MQVLKFLSPQYRVSIIHVQGLVCQEDLEHIGAEATNTQKMFSSY